MSNSYSCKTSCLPSARSIGRYCTQQIHNGLPKVKNIQSFYVYIKEKKNKYSRLNVYHFYVLIETFLMIWRDHRNTSKHSYLKYKIQICYANKVSINKTRASSHIINDWLDSKNWQNVVDSLLNEDNLGNRKDTPFRKSLTNRLHLNFASAHIHTHRHELDGVPGESWTAADCIDESHGIINVSLSSW